VSELIMSELMVSLLSFCSLKRSSRGRTRRRGKTGKESSENTGKN
jgi:hypothetical protein